MSFIRTVIWPPPGSHLCEATLDDRERIPLPGFLEDVNRAARKIAHRCAYPARGHPLAPRAPTLGPSRLEAAEDCSVLTEYDK